MIYQNIITDQRGGVLIIRLNRPQAMNALNAALLHELTHALEAAEQDDKVRVLILTGNDQAFAAGGDIREMKDLTFAEAYNSDFVSKHWEALTRCRKPVIAAVAGFALGGGCEMALMCDIIIAADNAKFGQPELTIGTIPGAGGTQRLARTLGKYGTMEMVLTGRLLDAHEAEKAAIAVKVVPLADLEKEAVAMAEKIASFSLPAVMMVKEAVNAAYDNTLQNGILHERRLFYATFATEDQKEGMAAFVEKRKPRFRDK